MPHAVRAGLVAGLLLLSAVPCARAQFEDIDQVLQGGTEDANLLLRRYMEPFGSGFGAGLNSGWVGAAYPHGLFGFHVRLGAGLALVPSSGEVFDVADGELSRLRLVNPEIGGSPTISGDDGGPTFRFETEARHPGTGEPIAAFEMPAGVGQPYVPTPEIQAGVGLLYDTALLLRLVPEIDLDEFGSIGLWGLGVQHGLNQWIPMGNLLPVSLSLQAGYTRLSMSVDIDALRDETELEQALTWDARAFTVNLLAGKTISVLSAYAGLGWETSSSDFALEGTYRIPTATGSETLVDPIAFGLKGSNGVHALAGLRIRLFILTLNAEYTLADYPSLNLGAGLSFR